MKEEHKLKEGTFVRHTSKPIEGRILGVTRIKALFEDISDEFEYRVQTREGVKICSRVNLDAQDAAHDATGKLSKNQSRAETGRYGVQLVCEELAQLGYKFVQMPDNNRGFDIKCVSPEGNPFRVEVKYSKAGHEFVHLQIRTHLECELQRDLLYVFIRPMSDVNSWSEFSIMTHEEVQAAWAKQPRTMDDGTPYVINGTGYVHWKHLAGHRDKWAKLPK